MLFYYFGRMLLEGGAGWNHVKFHVIAFMR